MKLGFDPYPLWLTFSIVLLAFSAKLFNEHKDMPLFGSLFLFSVMYFIYWVIGGLGIIF